MTTNANTCIVTLSAKKGDTQTAAFHIKQRTVYPSIVARFGFASLEWENLGTINPNKHQNGRGVCLPTEYSVTLRRSDFDPDQHTMADRTGHAGYVRHDGGIKQDPNPGTLVYRNRDLGEISGTLHLAGSGWRVDRMYWREYSDGLTDGDVKWLDEQCLPALVNHVATHREALRQQAIETIATRFAEQIEGATKQLAKLSEEAVKIMDVLREGGQA